MILSYLDLLLTQTYFILHTFIVLILLGKIILISIGLAIVCKKGPFWPRLGGTFGGMAPQRGTQTPAICGALKQWDLIRLSGISIEYYPTQEYNQNYISLENATTNRGGEQNQDTEILVNQLTFYFLQKSCGSRTFGFKIVP